MGYFYHIALGFDLSQYFFRSLEFSITEMSSNVFISP